MLTGLTVGMPVYNEAKYLQETLEALMKNYDAIDEIIISDNCSTDETAEICKQYASEYPKINYIRQEKSIPVSENFNFLLAKAHTPYFMWLGGHDILGSNYCKSMLQALNANPDSVAAMPMIFRFDDKIQEKKLLYDASKSQMDSDVVLERVFEVLDHRETLYIVNQIFKTDILKIISFEMRPEYINSDNIFPMHAVLLGHVVCVPEAAYYYRIFRVEALRQTRARYSKNFKIKMPVINPKGYIPQEYWRLCKKYIPEKCDKLLKDKIGSTCETIRDACFDNDTWLKRHRPWAMCTFLRELKKKIYILGDEDSDVLLKKWVQGLLVFDGYVNIQPGKNIDGVSLNDIQFDGSQIVIVASEQHEDEIIFQLERKGFVHGESFFLMEDFLVWNNSGYLRLKEIWARYTLIEMVNKFWGEYTIIEAVKKLVATIVGWR